MISLPMASKQATYCAMLSHYVDNCFLGPRFAFDTGGQKTDSEVFLNSVDKAQEAFIRGLDGTLANHEAWADERMSRFEFRVIAMISRMDLWKNNLPLMVQVYERSQKITGRQVTPLPYLDAINPSKS
jgi:hypothetical protein